MKDNKKNNKMNIGIFLKIIFFSLALFIVFIAGIVMFKATASPSKVPDIFGYKPMIVLSGSMETSIYTGDLVIVKEVDTTTLKESDVIAFRNKEDTVTTHRIIEIVYENGKTFFKTKGDNNNTEDADLVAVEDVEGIYVARIPNAGNFLMFIQQPIGLAVILLLILVIGLLWLYVANRMDEKKIKKEEEQDRKEFEEFKKMKEQQKLSQRDN